MNKKEDVIVEGRWAKTWHEFKWMVIYPGILITVVTIIMLIVVKFLA